MEDTASRAISRAITLFDLNRTRLELRKRFFDSEEAFLGRQGRVFMAVGGLAWRRHNRVAAERLAARFDDYTRAIEELREGRTVFARELLATMIGELLEPERHTRVLRRTRPLYRLPSPMAPGVAPSDPPSRHLTVLLHLLQELPRQQQ